MPTPSLDRILRRCAETLQGQGSPAQLSAFLRRELGCSRVESIQALAILKGTSLAEAKRLVQESAVWDDVDDSGRLHDDLAASAEDLWGTARQPQGSDEDSGV